MKQITRLILGMIALLVLVSCGQDPRKEAEATRIRTEAQSQAADAAQLREHNDAMNKLAEQERAAEIARINEVQAKRVAAINTMWTTFKIFGSVGLAVTLLALAVSISRASYGITQATVTAAEMRANLIPLDRVTRQFPLLRQVHGSKYALHNPNTGAVIMLDTERDEDRQLIAAMGMTQLAGVIASEARQSSDPAGLAMLQPRAVHAQQDGLIIGDEYLVNAIPLPGENA